MDAFTSDPNRSALIRNRQRSEGPLANRKESDCKTGPICRGSQLSGPPATRWFGVYLRVVGNSAARQAASPCVLRHQASFGATTLPEGRDGEDEIRMLVWDLQTGTVLDGKFRTGELFATHFGEYVPGLRRGAGALNLCFQADEVYRSSHPSLIDLLTTAASGGH